MKLVYKCKVNPQNGIWNIDNDKEHFPDKKLTKGLIHFFQDNQAKSIVDLGCGNGYYVKSLKEEGLNIHGYDGNPNTPQMTDGLCGIKDLSEPFLFDKKFDWVMSLEVGEHLPKKFESIFIDNLVNNAKTGVLVSWAVKGQGGVGHYNEQNNDYIIKQFEKRGMFYDEDTSNLLRSNCSLKWFRNTIMIFYVN